MGVDQEATGSEKIHLALEKAPSFSSSSPQSPLPPVLLPTCFPSPPLSSGLTSLTQDPRHKCHPRLPAPLPASGAQRHEASPSNTCLLMPLREPTQEYLSLFPQNGKK